MLTIISSPLYCNEILIGVEMCQRCATPVFKRLTELQFASVPRFGAYQDDVDFGRDPTLRQRPHLHRLLDWMEDLSAELTDLPQEVSERIAELFEPSARASMEQECFKMLGLAKAKLSKYIDKNGAKLRAFRVFHPINRGGPGSATKPFEDIFCRGASQADLDQFRAEFKLYEEIVVPDAEAEDFDILRFWRQRKERVPFLAKLAEGWLAFSGTSTEVERTFRALTC